jgi:quercetin dioxygenase-like cupin family protein
MSDKSGTIIRQGEGRVLHAFGEKVTILLDGERTGGKLTVWTEITPPDGGPPPHYHLNEDETFHVIDGRVAFLVDAQWHEVGAGGTALMPRGVVYTFKNTGDQPSRMLIMTMPSGIEKFFARCAAEFAKPGEPPEMARLVEIGAEHGIHFVLE